MACRLELDDLYQELSLCLLDALVGYDPDICPKLDEYLMAQLRFRLWNIAASSRRTSMKEAPKTGFSLLSLDATNKKGFTMQIPVYDEPSSVLWIEQEINALPPVQRQTVFRLLSGKRVHCNNKMLMAAQRRIKERIALTDKDK